MPRNRPLREPKDRHDRALIADVKSRGWHIPIINGDSEGPGFAFSVALFHWFDHPEVLVMGLPGETAVGIINAVGEAARAGKKMEPGKKYPDLIASHALMFLPIAKRHYMDYLGYAIWFYRPDEFPALQIVCPDEKGLFPHEPGYSKKHAETQRLLGPE